MNSPYNRFFKFSLKEKTKFFLQLFGCLLLIVGSISIFIIWINPQLSFICMFLFFFSLSIIAPFIDVPSMVKSGKITYHSLFFLAEKENKGVIKVHGGTLFDYYFVFQKNMKGQERTKLVIYEYLKGLKNLIESQNQDIIIEGTSYIINERTAKKLGLKKVQTNSSQLIILIFNYFNLAMSISLVKRKLHLPNLSNLNTYQGEVSAIKSKEVFIDKMISRLDANN